MSYRSRWTPDEAMRARILFESGKSWEEVGEIFGRTASGCESAVNRHCRRAKTIIAGSYYDGPAIAVTKDCERYRKDCRLGSTALKDAILDAQCAFANRHDIALTDAQNLLMGGLNRRVIPGTERIYKTASAQRMAA